MENLFNWFVIPFGVWYSGPIITLIIATVLAFFSKKSDRVRQTKNILFIVSLISFNIISIMVIINMINAVIPLVENQ